MQTRTSCPAYGSRRTLKIGAVVRVTVRKVWIALSDAYPWQDVFARVYEQLTAWHRPLPMWDSG